MVAENVFVVDFHSKVSEMSLSQYGWPQRKTFKTPQFLALTTLALSNRFSEKVYLEENEIKLVNISLKKPVKLKIYGYFHESVTNYYSRLLNCMYLQSAKPVAFI